jgi:hypothetical protein
MARKTQTAPAAVDVEVAGKPGLGIDEGIVLTTFFLLVAAVWLVVVANQAYN